MTARRALLALAALVLAALYWGNDLLVALESSAPSESIGTPGAGRLEHGKRLPARGRNFVAYSYLGVLLGRNAVHERVRATVLDAYRELSATHPTKTFVYGETGWPTGGRLWPHRTHQNGLSVDFMAPVVNEAGRPLPMPASPLTLWGYGVEFDRRGRAAWLRVDFEALAAHLLALDDAAARHDVALASVILDPWFVSAVVKTPQGRAVRARIPFLEGRPWIRHDDHYHVDFRVR